MSRPPGVRQGRGRSVRWIAWCGFLIGWVGLAPEGRAQPAAEAPRAAGRLFARDNLIAWCIVPFDSKKRGPEERAAMLELLGLKRFAYDWRPEHIPTFDAEIEAMERHGIALEGFWMAPGELNRESRLILDALKKHGTKTRLWVILDLGADPASGAEQERRVDLAAAKLRPLAEEAAKIGCTIGLYNHGGWFGEPENQIAIIERLKAQGVVDVGMVYNLHHGHEHLDRLPALLAKIKPYLVALNLNGMDRDGPKVGRQILPLGQGALDLDLLKTIRDSGYRGPIGILGHTMDDAEQRLQDNLDGLDWLVRQLDGKPAGPRPRPRTPVPPRPDESKAKAAAIAADAAHVAGLLKEAEDRGDPRRGAEVFASPKFACSSCHKVGAIGGMVGPELTTVGACVPREEIVEAVLWPGRKVKEGYATIAVATADGKVTRGYEQARTDRDLIVREAQTGAHVRIAKGDIEEVRQEGTVMPDGLAAAMTPEQRRDLIRFLTGLGKPGRTPADQLLKAAHEPAAFPFEAAPLRPELWPNRGHHINRDRVYDFYAKEAEYFGKQPTVPLLLPPFPGLDGGRYGHWGNQSEDTWTDDRWNRTELGSVLSGVFRGAGATVPKGVCVRLGDVGEMAACFNPETLCYEALWRGGFVKFAAQRHGLLDGLIMDGTALLKPDGQKPEKPFVYHGFYRHGKRVVFAYRIGEVEYLDAPWVEGGKFSRIVAPAGEHPLANLTRGGPAQWPQVFPTRGTLGKATPYAVDTIDPPFDNPWKAPLFFGGHDFLPDGTGMVCTMQGDVWRVEGLDDSLASVRWRRFASGLHQPLGLLVVDGRVDVLGRDQITRLHDLDGDGEADFYECVSNALPTSPSGHDFLCGLERDGAGRYYTASSAKGLLRLAADGKAVEVLATGFRNPDGLGLAPDGTVTVPSSEGNWVPASMICEIRPGGHYGYQGPKPGGPPDLPLVYLPRGLDNSSGGQAYVSSDRWGPLKGQMLHFSYGTGTYFLVLRETVDGQPQGAVVPMPGEFDSGAHRGRFNPKDGQLYVSGMGGWGTYTPADGCFQRVRYTGGPAQLPIASHARENGMLVTFSQPLDRSIAEHVRSHFAQAWNYRYGPQYGSPELSPHHPGMVGHDPLTIRSAHVLDDGRTLFLEIPDLQPVNQLHLHLKVDAGPPQDLIATVHKLAAPFTGLPDYRPTDKTIAAHPILADLSALANPPPPNPWGAPIANVRPITIEAGPNLTYSLKSFTVVAGELISVTFINPDAVPHNWALIRPGTLAKVGDLANRIIADPDAVGRHYIPRTDDVLAYTDIVGSQDRFTIYFRAPAAKGRYPYLCTFPGHWMVMNGEMIVMGKDAD